MRFHWEEIGPSWWILFDEQTRSSGSGIAAITIKGVNQRVTIHINNLPFIYYIDNDSSIEDIQVELLSIFQEPE